MVNVMDISCYEIMTNNDFKIIFLNFFNYLGEFTFRNSMNDPMLVLQKEPQEQPTHEAKTDWNAKEIVCCEIMTVFTTTGLIYTFIHTIV